MSATAAATSEGDKAAKWEPTPKLAEFLTKYANAPIKWKFLDSIMAGIAEVITELNRTKIAPLAERIAALEADIKTRPTLADAYKGTWQPSAFDPYERGAAVTFDGSLWLARTSTRSKPGTDDTWQLIVKKGRDAS